MFELLRTLSIDAGAGRATGEAFIPAGHPLFADHFPAHAILPGTLAMELAAQVAGPLAEEVVALRHGGREPRSGALTPPRSPSPWPRGSGRSRCCAASCCSPWWSPPLSGAPPLR